MEKWPKSTILAETPGFEPGVPQLGHDGLAIHDPSAPKAAISGNIACFYDVRACAECVRRASERNTFRHKSRHSSFGPSGHAENRCFDAKRARRAVYAIHAVHAERATELAPLVLEGLPSFREPQDQSHRRNAVNIVPADERQVSCLGEGRYEHHPCP